MENARTSKILRCRSFSTLFSLYTPYQIQAQRRVCNPLAPRGWRDLSKPFAQTGNRSHRFTAKAIRHCCPAKEKFDWFLANYNPNCRGQVDTCLQSCVSLEESSLRRQSGHVV